MRKILFVMLTVFLFQGIYAQEYFEKIIPGTSQGWTTWEYPTEIVLADQERIRLKIRYHADDAGPNPNNPGFVDYFLQGDTISNKVFWGDGLYGNYIPQYIRLSPENTMIVQSGYSNSRLGVYLFHEFIDLNHQKATYDYWYIHRNIAAINLQPFNGAFYGLYSSNEKLGYDHNDTIVLARVDFDSEEITLLEEYVLPFTPTNAGVFIYRPEAGQFDIVFNNYKVTFNLGQSLPDEIDSNFTIFASGGNYSFSSGSRALALMNGTKEFNLTPSGDYRFVFKDSLADSTIFKLEKPEPYDNSVFNVNAFEQDRENNLLVLTSNRDEISKQIKSRLIWRINQSNEIIEKIPVYLSNDTAQIYLIKEGENGNFVLAGSIEDKSERTLGVMEEIYLARINSNGRLIDNYEDDYQPIVIPNPANSYINIITSEFQENISYSVYTPEGKLIMSGSTSSYSAINVESLSSGMYILLIDQMDGRKLNQNIRFIKI